MNKNPLSLAGLLLAVSVAFLFSCNKQTSEPLPTNVVTITKVNAWLDEQSSHLDDVTKESISLLKKNLSFAKLTFEKVNDSEQFVIIPINSSFSIKGITSVANPINNLLVILDPRSNIRKGQIVQYQPENKEALDGIPHNTFFNIFHQGKLESNGTFQFYSLRQNLQYELTYKRGLMSSYGVVHLKDKSKQVATAPVTGGSGCIDWYLEAVDSDTGEVLSDTYLYTTCDSGDGGGGGGGGGGGSDPDNVGVQTQKDWSVVSNTSGLWSIISTENLTGLRTSEPSGGHFTGITHLGSSLIATSGFHWAEINSVSFSGASASSSVAGTMTFPDTSQQFIPTVTHTFPFAATFP